MRYDNRLTAAKLRRWETYLHDYRLPSWEEIPDLGLYMEQVLALLRQYLDYLPPELKDEQFITAATINNYVRNRFMPEPCRKKYYRVHIAYLIMICTLKQTLSIATLHSMIPVGLSEQEVREIYSAYAEKHRLAAEYFIQQVRLAAGPILAHERTQCALATSETSELISEIAILSGLSRLLAESSCCWRVRIWKLTRKVRWRSQSPPIRTLPANSGRFALPEACTAGRIRRGFRFT